MTKQYLEFMIKSLKKDIKILVKNKYAERTHDLLNMVMLEEIPELIKFLEHVNKVVNEEIGDVTDQYMKGYKDACEQIRREIFNENE